MTLYENVFIVRQDVSAQQVEDLTTRFTGLIADGGGTVTKNEYWGLRTLAYKIKKNRKGHYVLLNIDAPSDAVKEMERNMNLNEDVMRFMTIRVEEVDEGPSVMMRSRAARDERDRDRVRARPPARKDFGQDKAADKDKEAKAEGGAADKDKEAKAEGGAADKDKEAKAEGAAADKDKEAKTEGAAADKDQEAKAEGGAGAEGASDGAKQPASAEGGDK